MQETPTLYLMLGYPGAGKTTVSDIIRDLTGAVHLNSDRFRQHMFSKPLEITNEEHENMYKHLDYIAETILESGKSVIYDANLNKYAHRQEKYAIAKKLGVNTKLIWVKTDPEIARKRATIDAHNNPVNRPFGNMQTQTFERLVQGIEAPRDDEQAIEISGETISPENVAKALGI